MNTRDALKADIVQQSWKPQCPLQNLKQRAFLLSQIRAFFAEKGVLEVETPILSSAGNTDRHIESFSAQAIDPNNAKSYLRTSPEFHLKRLLCANIGDVYELGKVFRRSEVSKTHNVEFTMLEWYRNNYDYCDLIQEVDEFFKAILYSFGKKCRQTSVVTFSQCFDDYLSINLSQISDQELSNICQKHDYDGSFLLRDEALDYLFATQIQPQFDKEALTFVTMYPASQSALAQINPDDQNTCLRFEVFFQGHELGNAYQELTDGQELLMRFNKDNNHRKKYGFDCVEVDHHLIDAMNSGMPDCSGIAVGVDRLLMVLLDCQNINDVMTFTAINA